MQQLVVELSTCTDTLGVPLLKQEIWTIWDEQQCHLQCIQDPPDIQLYCRTGEVDKGGVKLPIYRCGCGSTSLESFHLHLARFIPGASANAVNFQAYFSDGITRWNATHAADSVDHQSSSTQLRTFDVRLQHRINSLSADLDKDKVFPLYRRPNMYTGEKLGIEYLYAQSGVVLVEKEGDLSDVIDEGIEADSNGNVDLEEGENYEDPLNKMITVESDETLLDKENIQGETEEQDEIAVDSQGLPGWDKVDKLAEALINLQGLFVTNSQAQVVKRLYKNLLDYDKEPLKYPAIYQTHSTRGRFAHKYCLGHVGVESMNRCFLSAGSPALQPSRSQVVEAICIRLTDTTTQPCVNAPGGYASR